MANFSRMSTTKRDTMLFMGSLSPWLSVTQEDLDTGHVTTVEFVKWTDSGEFCRRAYNMFRVYLRFCNLGKPLSEVKEGRAGGARPEMNAERVPFLFFSFSFSSLFLLYANSKIILILWQT